MVDQREQYQKEALLKRLDDVRRRIDDARERRGGDAPVELVAVSKTHPVEAIKVLYDAGIRSFGESYVQEWQDKAQALPDDIDWHFVGRLQSNKARFVADSVALIHSVDRKSVAKALNRRSDEKVNVLLQVNLALQDTKGGVAAEKLPQLFDLVSRYEGLQVRGLMGMPPYADDPEDNRIYFRRLRKALSDLQDYVERKYPERREILSELSMGMSNDFEVAVEEGATIVRLGTILFGKRVYDD